MGTIHRYCRICLETQSTNSSIYLHVQQKYLPSVIENICGVVISSFDEPEALICRECSEALVNADYIIQKCQESHRFLQGQQLIEQKPLHQEQEVKVIAKVENKEDWPTPGTVEFKQEQEEIIQADEEVEESTQYAHCFAEPELLVESILENSLHDEPLNKKRKKSKNTTSVKEKKPRKRRSRKKLQVTSSSEGKDFLDTERNPSSLLYQGHFKPSKPKKTIVRNREQYLKRKIRNYAVKEPLTLIGGAGVVRKRKPKSYHRAIPNFYFRCELCHEFESNVASYAVTHLTTVHGIERPAIFRCTQCDAKPFIKNQSLQEHIATIHEQQPKKRDYVCRECGKTYIKNSHLQKHLLSVHKTGEMPYKCHMPKCERGYVDAYSLRMHLMQTHAVDNEAELNALTTTHQCETCGDSFSDLKALNHHMKNTHPVEGYNCIYCGYNFRQKSRYDTHVRRCNCKPPSFVCRYCEKTFAKLVQLEQHQKEMH